MKYSQAATIKQTRALLAGEWLTAGALPTCYAQLSYYFYGNYSVRGGEAAAVQGWVLWHQDHLLPLGAGAAVGEGE